ncbi:MAG: sodium-dependent bicarbonate transport family permease [Micrococcales bacterium]
MNLELALTNITSIPILAFALGILASRLKTNLAVSKGAYEAISFILLLSIGIKGGVALRSENFQQVALPLGLTFVAGLLIPFIAYLLLRFVPGLSQIDRGAVAAHYGSTSLVTFSAALVFMDQAKIPYEGLVTTLLVAMEIPGILVGITLASGGLRGAGNSAVLREVFFGKTVLLLLGGLVMGLVSGAAAYEKVKPLFGDLQSGLLVLFLLTLGIKAGEKLSEFKTLGWRMVLFAIVMPVLGGAIGASLGVTSGLSAGGATALAVLCASASYIAAPAAVAIALPDAKASIPLVCSLAITFPFNLILGIPLYYQLAAALHG